MRIQARATLPLLVIAALAACARAEPRGLTPRAELVGVWDLMTVNGRTPPTQSPEEPNVMIESVVMTLGGAGAYTLASEIVVTGQEASQDVSIGGTWEADHTTLIFESEEGPAVVRFGYTHDDDLISMTDDQGNVWMMRRRD